MNQFNKIITPSNSIRDKRYVPQYTQTLNIPNNFKTRRIFLYSNIPINKKNSLFLQNRFNNNAPKLNSSISKTVSNISHIDYHNDSTNTRVITEYGNKINNTKYRGKNIYINTNNKIQKDLEMMKLQMSCDIITHKINQIKDKVQNLHESSIEEDKNLINKNIGINIYQKKKTNMMNFYSNKEFNSNNNNNKRYIFTDFSKVRNKKFLRISNEMSKEINNTFDNSELNHIDDTIRTYQDSKLNVDIYRKTLNNKIPKFPYKNNLKYFLLNTQNNSKDIFNDNNDNNTSSNKFELKSNTLNNIDKTGNLNYINNNNNLKKYIKNNNKIIKPYKNRQRIKKPKIILTESNSIKSNNINNIRGENIDKNRIYNKVKIIENKNKTKVKENNIQTNSKNNFEIFSPKFGSLDKYFMNDKINKNINSPKENNLYGKNNQYNISKINKEIKKQNDSNQYNEDNEIKVEDNNNEKLLLYSNLEQSKQGNLNLNKYFKKNFNKNNLYTKLQNNNEKEIDNKNIKNKLNDINKEKNNNNGDVLTNSHFNLKKENLKNFDKNDKIEKNQSIDKEIILDTNNNQIQPDNNIINNKDNIKDNNFKININNIANYSIKNNCLNINNSSNKNKQVENTTNNIDESNIKDKGQLSHNYSKDDLLLTTEKINLEYSPDELLEKNSINANINNDIIKRNLTFEKDDIILDPIKEEDINNAINKKKKRKNIFIMPIRTKYKHKDKKVKIKHKELCHKFTDNPQHFFTEKLNEMMLKALNINTIKGINIKK